MGFPILFGEPMKEFFTYEQQVEKLRADSLTIDDEAYLISVLRDKGYYNVITGYSSVFKQGKKYYNGITIRHIMALYNFDKNLRNLIYKNTSSIESHIKALVAHEFSEHHGIDETVYLQEASFSSVEDDAEEVKKLISICNKTIDNALKENSNTFRAYLSHYKTKHNIIPLWVLVRTLTFGNTAVFYKLMKRAEQERVSANFKITPEQLLNMLEVIVSFRNIVAHGERTYCVRLPKARLSTALPIAQKLLIFKNDAGESMYGKSDFLALLIACKYLLPPFEFAGMMEEFEAYLEELKTKLPAEQFAKIKQDMGLKTNAWKNLAKLHI